MREIVAIGLMLVAVAWCGDAMADCSGGAKRSQWGCGKIGFAGCCDGETLTFCEGGGTCVLDCAKNLHCGFDAKKGFYDCGTDGQADPTGEFPKECPPKDNCKGVGYEGCCAGDVTWWCQENGLKSLDCSANETQNKCGFSQEKQAADCVAAESPGAAVCPFTVQDIGPGDEDVVSSPDCVGGSDAGACGAGDTGGRAGADAWPATDGVVVPDVNAPSSCATAGMRYEVETTDCLIFSARFSLKQEGCGLVLVGLVPTANEDPAGYATSSGVAFSFTDAGMARECVGQFTDQGISGTCGWGGAAQCTFAFAKAPDPVAPVEPGGTGGGGCSTSDRPATVPWLLLLTGLFASLRSLPLAREGMAQWAARTGLGSSTPPRPRGGGARRAPGESELRRHTSEVGRSKTVAPLVANVYNGARVEVGGMAKSRSRKPHVGGAGASTSGSGGGIFSSMRGGLRGLVGSGPQKKKPTTFWDVLFWIAALLLGAAVIYRWVR